MTATTGRVPRGRRGVRLVVIPLAVTLLVVVGVCVGVTAFTLVLPAMRADAVPVTTSPATCTTHALQMVAHPDDDLLFMNPDIINEVERGACVRTVFLTTGDANRDASYWRLREDGIRAAYATMAGAEDEWTLGTLEIEGRDLQLATLDDAPGISLVFMHLPDGNRRGTGNAIHGRQSLLRLWTGEIETIDAVDGSASYTSGDLRRTLTALIDDFHTDTLRAQDWTLDFRTGDNADHTAAARYVRAAAAQATSAHRLLAYAGYPSWTQPANVNGRELGLKADAIMAYAEHDPKLCAHLQCVESLVTAIRNGRQYVVVAEALDLVVDKAVGRRDGE
ncbi:PIG-L family deacetylase [Actinotalea fermentans]|uniref:PIG-L family deacetylase n=1 Tax=Actinotalea fermentans TaxID=43671 RepID=UPI001C99348E|nr:PIG-L family deacetylase [Actinotalea fermentans]